MSRRRSITAFALVGSLAAITAGTWGLARWRPFEHEAPAIAWPENVQPIVDFIEDVTTLHFRHELTFEYIADRDRYNERAGTPARPLTEAGRARVTVDEAVGRALGLWASDTSLTAAFDTLVAATPRPVRWFPDSNVVVINGHPDRELPPAVRADLVVYLTQAAVEQNFHLIAVRDAATTSQEYDVIAGLQIGVALWVREQYVTEFDRRDRRTYEADTQARGQTYTDSVASVPATLKATRIAFQVLGPTFITSLAEHDPALVIRALTTKQPAAMDQITLPTAKYRRTDPLEPVEAPPAPRRASIRYSDQLGPFRLFLMFATGMPATDALTASDGWGNDRYTVYQLADSETVCVDIHVVADSPDDADRLDVALHGWARVRPAGAHALVGRDGVHLYASVCDPGTARQPIASETTIEQYFGRAELIRQLASGTENPEIAECIATEFFARFTIEQMSAGLDGREIDAAYFAIEDDCRRRL